MEDYQTGRPKPEEVYLINKFFEIVIKDTFAKNGISHLTEMMEGEIECKKKYLMQDMDSEGRDRFFLVVRDKSRIIGTIEYGRPNDLIMKCTKGRYIDVIEIGTVFVHPDYQYKGIGSMMLRMMYGELRNKGYTEFCLDSGYKTAQKVWTSKWGKPSCIMEDYWGKKAHHMVWRVDFARD
jgi:GNAT superfamily N-acetyltransferase